MTTQKDFSGIAPYQAEYFERARLAEKKVLALAPTLNLDKLEVLKVSIVLAINAVYGERVSDAPGMSALEVWKDEVEYGDGAPALDPFLKAEGITEPGATKALKEFVYQYGACYVFGRTEICRDQAVDRRTF